MYDPVALERYKTFIDCQLNAGKGADVSRLSASEQPTVTISRLTGAGARTVAADLAEYLQNHDRQARAPWTVFDRNLVEKVLEDHHLPQRLAQYMPEKKVLGIDDAMGEILGLHPSLWTLVQHTTDTIIRLAQIGNVILVGRGATLVTSGLQNVFHVRLVGSIDKRAQHVQDYFQFDRAQALDYIKKKDRERRRYLKKYFGQKIDDPLRYHLVVNTDWITYKDAAIIIGQAVLRYFNRDTPATQISDRHAAVAQK
jgi:cytidylate kinase